MACWISNVKFRKSSENINKNVIFLWNSSFNCGETTSTSTPPPVLRPNQFSGTKATAACEKYTEVSTPYNNWNIINGIPVGQGEYPHMVALGYRNRDSSDYDFDCGGTLIAEQWVVTAAHCIKDRRKPVMIRMGKVCFHLLQTNNLLKSIDFSFQKLWFSLISVGFTWWWCWWAHSDRSSNQGNIGN